jgi:hypothetical protein
MHIPGVGLNLRLDNGVGHYAGCAEEGGLDRCAAARQRYRSLDVKLQMIRDRRV